jgi:hypothetical protein
VGRRRVSGVATNALFQTRLNPSAMARSCPGHRPGCDVCAIGDDEGAAGAEAVVGGCWRNGSGTAQ